MIREPLLVRGSFFVNQPWACQSTTTERNGAGVFVLAVCIALLWLIVRPYQWINGDAQLYALQALAHAYPTRFSNDLFFLFGSQDRYTLLTNLIAPIYAQMGVDRAAFTLTVLSSALWALACFGLSAAAVDRKLAWLSLACAVVATGAYGGGGDVFQYAEGYFSARLPAEAMILGALSLQMRRRTGWSLLLWICAALVHPIMTAPALAVAILITIPERVWPLSLAAAGSICALIFALALAMPFGRVVVVDSTWLTFIDRRSPFLFLSHWSTADWGRVGVIMGSLLVAGQLLARSDGGRLARATLAISILGVLVAFVGSDVLPVAIILQAQPWRAMWLATLVAAVLLPAVVRAGWEGEPLHRAAALLVCAAIMDVESSASLPAAMTAVATACWPGDPTARVARLIVGTASVVFLTCLTLNIFAAADSLGLPMLGPPEEQHLEALRNIARFSCAPAALTLVVWILCVRHPTVAGTAVAAVAMITLGVHMLHPAVRQARMQAYSGPVHAAFASWRDAIPPGATVLWIENPSAVWFLLERPNFVSVHQLAGVVFSRNLALEARSRIRTVELLADASSVFGDIPKERRHLPALSADSLGRACSDPRLNYVVSGDSLPSAVAQLNWPDASRFIYLYDCDTTHGSVLPGR